MFFWVIILAVLQSLVLGQLPQDTEDRDFWRAKAQDDLANTLQHTENTNVAKNLVMFLGDGMGISTINAARIRKGQLAGNSGEETVLNMETFPHVGLSKVYNTDKQVPDSAGSATAYLTGVKTKFGQVGVDTKSQTGDCESSIGREVTSILDWALEADKSVGIVSTAKITHASPSAAYAHTPYRLWESDRDMKDVEGGCKDIARQLIEDNPNIQVLLSGGRQKFLPTNINDPETGMPNAKGRLDGRDLIQEWIDEKKTRGVSHEFVYNKEQFDAVNPDTTDYLFGLFENSYMQYELERDSGPEGEPSITEMTEKAIKILSKNPNGFFLFVEGAKVDLAHHGNFAKKAIHEVISLDDAVAKGVEMLDPAESLVVVTADHSHPLTITGFSSRGSNILGLEDGPMRTLDGKPFSILSYSIGPGHKSADDGSRLDLTDVDMEGTNYQFPSMVPMPYDYHSGEDVAIYAKGPMSHLFTGVHEQNYIAHAMAYAACIGNNVEHCTSNAPPSSRAVRGKMLRNRKLRKILDQMEEE